MNISKNFYTNWATSEEPNYYLYVSEKDSLISALKFRKKFKYFGFNFNTAKRIKNSYDKSEYSTLLYKTYGTSGAQLSKHLLSYAAESVSFIAFHEATHQHISVNTKMPYSLNEAMCDVIGNYGTLNLFSQNIELDKIKAEKHIENIEEIALEINMLINNFEVEKSNIELKNKTQKLKENKEKFLTERYDYEINNAYLLRNSNYTKHYFKLKKLLILINNLKEFIEFMITLPPEESSCISIIDKKIKTLSKSID